VQYGKFMEKEALLSMAMHGCDIRCSDRLDHEYKVDGLVTGIDGRAIEPIAVQVTTRTDESGKCMVACRAALSRFNRFVFLVLVGFRKEDFKKHRCMRPLKEALVILS